MMRDFRDLCAFTNLLGNRAMTARLTAALDIVKQTDFSIDQCVRRLLEVYGV